MPLLQAFADTPRSQRPARKWIKRCTKRVGKLLGALESGIAEVQDNRSDELVCSFVTVGFESDSPLAQFSAMDDPNVIIPQIVTLERTGKRGRPRKIVNRHYLANAFAGV